MFEETIVTLVRRSETAKNTIGGVKVSEDKYELPARLSISESSTDVDVQDVSMVSGQVRLYVRWDAKATHVVTKIPATARSLGIRSRDEFIIGSERFLVSNVHYRHRTGRYIVNLRKKAKTGGV